METENKKIYMVYTDPSMDGYGSAIYLAGVFESESDATKRAKEVSNEIKIAACKNRYYRNMESKYFDSLAWIVAVELNQRYAADKDYIYDPDYMESEEKADYVYIGGYRE